MRKNPLAVLDLFQEAFPLDNFNTESLNVALVIKTLPVPKYSHAYEILLERASLDRRIYLFSESMSRTNLLKLYASCDVFVSLHRSEGFGRNLAEAFQLGLHVATNYGGNTDFCDGPLSPVCVISTIPACSYPFADGHE